MLKDAEHLLENNMGEKITSGSRNGFLLGEQDAYSGEQTAFPNCISTVLLIFRCAPCISGPWINAGELTSWPDMAFQGRAEVMLRAVAHPACV